MDDHNYNLMIQLVEESKALNRIQNHYLEDAGDCEECREFWKMMEEDKKEHIEDLKELISKHL